MMLRTLSNNELQQVSGGEQYYFPAVSGYEIVGVDVTVVGYDVVTWTEYPSIFTAIDHESVTPIYQYTPIYAPVTTTIYYY